MSTLLQEGEVEMGKEVENCSEDEMWMETPSSEMTFALPGKETAEGIRFLLVCTKWQRKVLWSWRKTLTKRKIGVKLAINIFKLAIRNKFHEIKSQLELKEERKTNSFKIELHIVWEEGMKCCFWLQATWPTRPLPTLCYCFLQYCHCFHHYKWKLRALSTDHSQIPVQQRALRLKFAFLNCWKYWLNGIREEPAGHGIPWPCSFLQK